MFVGSKRSKIPYVFRVEFSTEEPFTGGRGARTLEILFKFGVLTPLLHITFYFMKYALTLASALAFVPVAAFAAQNAPDLNNLSTLATQIGELVDLLLPIAVTLAVLFFFWGLAEFILASGEESAKEEGRRKMIWGVVALFVIVSIWGIIAFLGNLLGIGQGGQAPVPGVENIENSGHITPIN